MNISYIPINQRLPSDFVGICSEGRRRQKEIALVGRVLIFLTVEAYIIFSLYRNQAPIVYRYT